LIDDCGGDAAIFAEIILNVSMKRIEFAWTVGGLARPEVLLGAPVGHGAGIKSEFPGDLRGIQALMRMEMFDLREAVIIDHERSPNGDPTL
jgi:hypothetical protein